MEFIALEQRNRSSWSTVLGSLAILSAMAVILAGCMSAPPPQGGLAPAEDKLVIGDIIGIKIQGVADPPTFEGPIDEKGEIEMLYYGKIKAAGLTASELADRIKYLSVQLGIYPPSIIDKMIVTVVVGTRFYYITGEAAKGRYPLSTPLTVCRALLASGGTSEFANLKKVIIHRGTQTFRVNCAKAQIDPKYDMWIQAGDIIEVPKKGILPFL